MNALRPTRQFPETPTSSPPTTTHPPPPPPPPSPTPMAATTPQDTSLPPPPPSRPSTPPETRKESHARAINAINTEILSLQRRVDHNLEQIRHLIASREVAIAHEAELSRIDRAYADEAGRQKVLLRVESFAGGKEKEGKEEGGMKQKKKLINYGRRGTIKRAPGAKEG